MLAAYMLGSSSLWAAETGNGALAVDLVGRATRRIPHAVPPTVTAWMAALEATAHASLRDADATFAALKRASDRVGPDQEPTWPWLYPFDAAKLAGYLGACATMLKLPKTAIPALTDALPAEPTKQRALVLADLSTNHAALGQLDQARAYAAEAASIARKRASAKLARRIPQLA